MKVNANIEVKATLTAYGASVMNTYLYGIPSQQTYSEGDTIALPFWEIANIFGKSMYNGAKHIPFVGNEIEFTLPKETNK